MDEDDARARDIALANLRVEVGTLTDRTSSASLPGRPLRSGTW
jgi:hypothetical protein